MNDDFLEIVLDTLGSLLGEQQVIVAKDDVDDFLAVARFSEVLDNLLDHDKVFPDCSGANKHKPLPDSSVKSNSRHIDLKKCLKECLKECLFCDSNVPIIKISMKNSILFTND